MMLVPGDAMTKQFGKRGATSAVAAKAASSAAIHSAPAGRTTGFGLATLAAAALALLALGGGAYLLLRPAPTKFESHIAFLGKLKAQQLDKLDGDPQPLSTIFMPVAFSHSVTNFMMTSRPEQRLSENVMAAISAMAGNDGSGFAEVRTNFAGEGPRRSSSAGPEGVAQQVDDLRRLLVDEKGLCTLAKLDWVVSAYRDYSQARDNAVQIALASGDHDAARREAARWRSVDVWLADRLKALSKDGYLAIPARMRRAAAPILWEIRETMPSRDQCPDLRAPEGLPSFQNPTTPFAPQR